MSADTPEIRRELELAWRAVSDRLIGCGYSRSAVVETMMGIALGDLDGLSGLQGSTHFILKARRLRRQPSADGLPEPDQAARDGVGP